MKTSLESWSQGTAEPGPRGSQLCARLLVQPVSSLWLDNLRPFTVPGPSCSSLEDSGPGEGRLKLLPPVLSGGSEASANQWLCQRAGSTWLAPPLQGWLLRPRKQSRGPGPEHHLSALHGGSGLVSMATVQCEGILAALRSALSSINRGCSRLHAYYEQSRALSTGNYA